MIIISFSADMSNDVKILTKLAICQSDGSVGFFALNEGMPNRRASTSKLRKHKESILWNLLICKVTFQEPIDMPDPLYTSFPIKLMRSL